jgi:hypothetical protein
MPTTSMAHELAIGVAVNGTQRAVTVDVRTSLLDLLRERLERAGRTIRSTSSQQFDSSGQFCQGSREIPSLRIFEINVVRFNPSLAAAPWWPPTTHFVSRSTDAMCARSRDPLNRSGT